MLSRAADSMYWMSRYLERADNVARFIRVNIHLILDLGFEDDDSKWNALIHASGDEEAFSKRYKKANEENVIRFLTFDVENPNSILSCIQSARENARTVREIISSDMWENINEFYHLVQKHSRKRHLDDLQEFYTQIRMATHTFTGLTENTMSTGEGWHFMRMARMLERADKTARILDVKYFWLLPDLEYFDSPYDAVEWGAVLKSVNAFEMYRKQHQRINYKDVTDFLIFDYHFPRSMTFCVHSASNSLESIIGFLGVKVSAQREMHTLLKMLKNTNITDVLSAGLHEFIDIFQYNLNVVDQSIYESFIAQKAP